MHTDVFVVISKRRLTLHGKVCTYYILGCTTVCTMYATLKPFRYSLLCVVTTQQLKTVYTHLATVCKVVLRLLQGYYMYVCAWIYFFVIVTCTDANRVT